MTGGNRGLGYELHKLLTQKTLPLAQRIFILRNALGTPQEGCEYIQADLEKDFISWKFNVSDDSKVVVFINNSGTVEPIEKAVNLEVEDLERAMKINCIAPFSIVKYLTLETKRIDAKLFVLNISSGAAKRPINGWLAYCVSKAAVIMSMDVLAAENEHVTVLHFDPGVMDTDMQSYIRHQNSETMPSIDVFRGYKNDNSLKQPREVAEKIFAIVREAIQ